MKLIQPKTIVYKDLFNSYIENWISYSVIGCENLLSQETCGNFKIIRVQDCTFSNYHSLVFKTFELKPHYQLTLEFKFLKRKILLDSVFIVYIDNKIEHKQTYYTNEDPTNTCQISNFFNFFPISITNYHYSSTVTIAMIAEKGFWGITEIELSINECARGCDSCNSSGCLNQHLFFQLFNQKQFIVQEEEGWKSDGIVQQTIKECYGFNYIIYNKNNLMKQFELDLHYTIRFQLKLLIFNSQFTQVNIMIDDNLVFTTNYEHKLVQFQGLICNYVSVDEINLEYSYQHHNSNLKISIKVDLQNLDTNLTKFIGMRDFKLFLKLFDDGCIDNNIVPFDGCYSNNYDCIQGCRNCIKGICQNCLDGFWYQEQTQICIPQCGDSIITLNEECDDGNKIGYDGCYECKYQCSQNCEKCQFGKCLECQVEYQLDFYKIKCIPKCGDDVITSQELFDDGNNIQFDGYHKCLNYCQIECLLCFDNKCYNCQEGWQLQEYQCIQICGDSEQYQIPYQMNNGKCLPICGDNIITPIFEQCDDGNDIPYDGCFQCLYSCSYGCIQCEKDNHCLLCEDQNYILDTQTFQCNLQQQNIETNTEVIINDNDQLIVQCNKNQAFIQNKCVNLCGNGILKSEFEQCDDGNNNGGDGCSALCFQEDSYECNNQENQLSICTFIQTPNFNLILLSDKQNQTKIIELIFSQQVYISSKLNFEQIIEFIILNEIQIAFSLIPFQNITSQLSNPKYKILIQFLEPVANPILKVTIQKYSIFNSYDMELNNNQIQLQLGTPFVLSEATQKRVNQIIQMNDAVIYTTVGIAGFLFLTGNYIVFFNLLDLLQTLSYIRYMQYRFPPHLRQFLDIYTKISLQPILDSLNVDELIAKVNGGSIPYFNNSNYQSQQTNALNQFYLINAKSCLITYIFSFLTYLICCLISTNKVSQWLRVCFRKNKLNIQILRLISKIQKKIYLQCSYIKRDYFSLGIFQLFFSTLHQLLFSTLLQFPQYTFNSLFEIFNSFAAIGSLLYQIYMFLKLLSITTSQIKNRQKWKYFFLEQKTQFWAANFKSFQIFRIVFYITIIVELINYPEAQSILLSMQSFFYLIYLIQFRPIKSKFEQYKLVCREVILLITSGSFLIYALELNYNQYLIYGWLHIALLSFLMGFTLIVDIFEQLQKTYHNHLKKKLNQKRKKIQSYYINPLQKFVVYDLKDIE